MAVANDRTIRELLPQFDIRTPEGFDPFDPAVQIQPASIDLRLSPIIWTQRRTRRSIDLVKSRLMEVAPRRYWNRRDIGVGSIVLRPGETIFACTLEEFTVPSQFCAELYGRSSYSRLGLQVHLSGNFINPGWRGHCPLQLTNSGKIPLVMRAGLPLCQVSFSSLSDEPERTYGAQSLASKYMNDDGGPSYWWRDKLVQRLLAELDQHDVSAAAQTRLIEALRYPEPDTIERFEKFLSKKSPDLDDVTGLLAAFVANERRLELRDKFLVRGSGAMGVVLVGAALTLCLSRSWTAMAILAIASITCGVAYVSFTAWTGDRNYFRAGGSEA